jgi:type IX secretion system PorP/SprF family membrane protein
MIYRHQSTGSDYAISSSLISAAYPLLNRKSKQRWGGVGITLLDDRSGTAGIFHIQEATASYASNIPLSKTQSIALGAKVLYQQQRVNPAGLFTGSQYVPDRGFDEGIFSGETFDQVRTDFMTLSMGLQWQKTDRYNQRIAYWGVSFFDINKPDNSFLGGDSQLNSTLVAEAGWQVYQNGSLSLIPEVLYTRNSSNNTINLGAVTRYRLNAAGNSSSGYVDVITKYVIGRSAILGVQFHQENFSVGFSYDFPLLLQNQGNLGALEVALELRQLVNPKFRNKLSSRKSKSVPPPVKPRTATTSANRESKPASDDASPAVQSSTGLKGNKPVSLKENLQHKQDSVLALTSVGTIQHEALVIDRMTLRFNFDFNSSTLDQPSTEFLNDLAVALEENDQLSIKLTGHTDNIGSPRYNDRLSLQRANAIKYILVEQGVHSSRIITEGKGIHEPLNSNETPEERAMNRRVEVTILYRH